MSETRWTLPPFIVHQTLFADQLDSKLPWHISEYGIDQHVWPKVVSGVKVGVVDTGASMTHPEFANVIIDQKDYTKSKYGPSDGNGHGTHVAGIIAAKSFGVYKGGTLFIAKGLSDNGSGSDATLAAACKGCADAGCKVINISAGASQRSSHISGVLKELSQQGILIVVAAGNETSNVGWPAREEFVFAITAIDRDRRIAEYSNRGDAADIAAPGSEIRSLGRGGTYAVMSGTSMASPWAAGYIAAYASWRLSTGKSFPTFNEVMTWLSSNVVDLGKPGKDWEYGIGLPEPKQAFVDIAPKPPTAPTTPGDGGVVQSGFPASIIVTMPSGKQAIYTGAKQL